MSSVNLMSCMTFVPFAIGCCGRASVRSSLPCSRPSPDRQALATETAQADGTSMPKMMKLAIVSRVGR